MPFKRNENLSGALRASLRLIESEDKKSEEKSLVPPKAMPGPAGGNYISPLTEVAADSIDLELDRINENLVQGTPEKITDEALERLVDLYRAQALRWEQEEATKKPHRGQKKVSHIEAMEL
jgi:hypothetical protein